MDAYDAGLKVDPENESYKQEKERCATFQQAAPFLRPDWAGVLSSNAATTSLMADEKFVQKIQAIRANPALMQSMLQMDQEVMNAYIVLSGLQGKMMEQQRREEERKRDEARKKREEQKKRDEEAAAKKRQEEFEKLPENKQKAITLKNEGNEAYKAQDFKKALELYQKAAEMDDTESVYHMNMASAYMGMKEYESCVKSCDKALEIGKENKADYETIGKAYFRKAKALAKLQKWRECVEAYDTGLLNHRDPQAVRFRNQAEEKMNEQEALAYQDPEKAEQAKAEGNEYFKKAEWGDAIRSYSEAIKRNPKHAVYYSNRATTYMKVREYKLALQDADKCLELDPSYVKGWVRKGMAHHHMKEFYKALEAYDKGLKIDPENPELNEWTQKSQMAIQMMHTQQGEGDAEEARKRAMSDPDIQRVLQDGEVQNFIRTLQDGNQNAAREMLAKSSTLNEKYQKLVKAGIM